MINTIGEDTRRRAQLCMLEILKEFKRACCVLGLHYFLDSGTLLGAVRHQGFIPWDDDIDVGMLRKEYDYFLEKAPEVLSDKYFLQTWYSDENYGLAFAKLRMKNTVYLEEGAKDTNAENGFYIDIFPYDEFPLSVKDRKCQGRRYDLLRRALLVKAGYTPWIMSSGPFRRGFKKVLYWPIIIFSAMHSRAKLISMYEEMCTMYNGENTGLLFEQAGASNYGKWVIPASCFSAFEELLFENEYFSVPKDYDVYLKAAYGDYMELPPENDRINRHRIIEIRFPTSEGMKNNDLI